MGNSPKRDDSAYGDPRAGGSAFADSVSAVDSLAGERSGDQLRPNAALSRLIDGAARISGTHPDDMRRLAALMLATRRGGRSRSALNYDSSPVQFCVTNAPNQQRFRLLVDPASTEPDIAQRYRLSRSALQALASLKGQSELATLFEQTLDFHVDEAEFDHPDGVLWIGCTLDDPCGLAMYVDARRGGPEAAFDRLTRWYLHLAGPKPPRQLHDFLDGLKRYARLMSLGLEGSSLSRTRAKVYWRLDQPRLLSSLGIAGLDDSRILEFLELAAGDREIRLDGVVLNAGFHVGSGQPTDIKVDLCCCQNCLSWDADEACRRIEQVADLIGVSSPPVAQMLQYGELANIGVGLNHAGELRMNTYLKVKPQ